MPEMSWEYRVGTLTDGEDIDAYLAEWATAGWELVSGSVAGYTGSSLTSPGMLGPRFLYVTYWRRRSGT
jgi:hypothetical protein